MHRHAGDWRTVIVIGAFVTITSACGPDLTLEGTDDLGESSTGEGPDNPSNDPPDNPPDEPTPEPSEPPPEGTDCVDPECYIWFRSTGISGLAHDVASLPSGALVIAVQQPDEYHSDLVLGSFDTADKTIEARWQRVYRSPWKGVFLEVALAAQPDDGVAVAALTEGIKEDEVFVWIRSYLANGGVRFTDSKGSEHTGASLTRAASIAVDDDGNVFTVVAGDERSKLFAFTAAGDEWWNEEAPYWARFVAVRSPDGPIVLGTVEATKQLSITEFAADGGESSSASIPGSPETRDPIGLAMSSDGGRLLAARNQDVWVGHYDASGKQSWTLSLGDLDDQPIDFTIDPAGYSWWAGTRGGQVWLAALDPQGELAGMWTYEGATRAVGISSSPQAVWVVAHDDGEVLVGRIDHRLLHGG